jgi:hypothetical protein
LWQAIKAQTLWGVGVSKVVAFSGGRYRIDWSARRLSALFGIKQLELLAINVESPANNRGVLACIVK